MVPLPTRYTDENIGGSNRVRAEAGEVNRVNSAEVVPNPVPVHVEKGRQLSPSQRCSHRRQDAVEETTEHPIEVRVVSPSLPPGRIGVTVGGEDRHKRTVVGARIVNPVPNTSVVDVIRGTVICQYSRRYTRSEPSSVFVQDCRRNCVRQDCIIALGIATIFLSVDRFA